MYTKLNEMNDFLGGEKFASNYNCKAEKQRRGNNEFEMIKNEFLEKRHEVEKMLEEKEDLKVDKTRLGRITFKIREGITVMTGMLDRMSDEIQRGSKNVLAH
jgi:hypothetical protein